MEGEGEAMEIFELVKRGNMLPTKIDELVPLSFIGQAAVGFYRQKIKLMDQLKMTEKQRKVTLSDGQDAGEMLLDIEARIGELAYEEEKAESLHPKGKSGGSTPSGAKPKYERMGLKRNEMSRSQAISNNPAIVARVKKQAKENEDIPTKGQVLSEIKYEKEKKRRKEAEGKKGPIKGVIAIDQLKYINALDRCISILPQKPPKKWNEEALREATAKAKIITKRLEVFNGK